MRNTRLLGFSLHWIRLKMVDVGRDNLNPHKFDPVQSKWTYSEPSFYDDSGVECYKLAYLHINEVPMDTIVSDNVKSYYINEFKLKIEINNDKLENALWIETPAFKSFDFNRFVKKD